MLKAWLNLWKNTFNYTGIVSRKEYWLACITNIIAMYVFVIPCAFISAIFSIPTEICIGVFFIIFLTPTVALYFRRANDTNWKRLTALLMALVCPIFSGIIVGVLPTVPKEVSWPRFYSIISKIFALSYGLFFYGDFLSIIFFDDVAALSILSFSGIFLATFTLMFIGIKMLIAKIKMLIAIIKNEEIDL